MHTVAFLVAGIFASRVTNARSEVLLKSSACGSWHLSGNPNYEEQDVENAQLEEYFAYTATLSRNIVTQ